VFVDAREQTKNLLPRRVSERLETVDLSMLHALSDEKEPGKANEHGEILAEWQKRRLVGIFYVSDYAGPALILRVGELKRSWFDGRLAAKFLVYDTESSRSLCGYPLAVQNDTKDAPIRSRLQAETRIRLERELSDALVAAARKVLASDLPALRFPESTTGARLPDASTGVVAPR
jgi:hypothetical protein